MEAKELMKITSSTLFKNY